MEIQTKSASLDTLSVTIQALHVNGKQMTLAVFRQLTKARITNDDGSLAPMECWGIVRYNIKDEGDLWVVAASGGRLYRCRLNIESQIELLSEFRDELRTAIQMVDWWNKCKKLKVEENAPDYNLPRPPNRAVKWNENSIDGLNHSVDSWRRCIIETERIIKTMNSLLQLPQLFIAV